MKGVEKKIQEALKYDALSDAEKDTKFIETEVDYLKKVSDFGFKSLLVEPFINEDKVEERLHIMFH